MALFFLAGLLNAGVMGGSHGALAGEAARSEKVVMIDLTTPLDIDELRDVHSICYIPMILVFLRM